MKHQSSSYRNKITMINMLTIMNTITTTMTMITTSILTVIVRWRNTNATASMNNWLGFYLTILELETSSMFWMYI